MDEYTIRQAIDLIHARRYTDARKLLRPVLEVNPTNEAAWIWFASTFSSPAEKMVVYKAGYAFCVDSEPLQRWIEKCKEEIEDLKSKGEEPERPDITNELPQNARDLKKVEEPKLSLPEPGTPFEWHEPLVGKKRKTAPLTGLFTQESEQEPKVDETIENQPADWMDSLRGTMDAAEEQSAAADGMISISSELDLQARFPGEEEKKEEPPASSLTKTLTNIWGAITHGEEEPKQKPAEAANKPSLSQKISSIWEKWGEEPTPEPEPEVNSSGEQRPFPGPFFDTGSPEETNISLHPEFFEQPKPEPQPEPFEEPVVVWGTQQIANPAEKSVLPWEISTISARAQDATTLPQDTGVSLAGEAETDHKNEALEPYQLAYQIAVTAGILLLLVVIMIFGIDFI